MPHQNAPLARLRRPGQRTLRFNRAQACNLPLRNVELRERHRRILHWRGSEHELMRFVPALRQLHTLSTDNRRYVRLLFGRYQQWACQPFEQLRPAELHFGSAANRLLIRAHFTFLELAVFQPMR